MTHEHLQELYEIADGSYGDGPWMRGLAAEKIRKAGYPYPPASQSAEQIADVLAATGMG